MAEKIVMTALSPTMESGTIISWMKKEQEQVVSGDVLCEVETDKTSMEYESVQEGVLLKIIKGNGMEAKIGDAIAIIGEKSESIEAIMEKIATAEAHSAEKTAPATTKDPTPTTPQPAGENVRTADSRPASAPPSPETLPRSNADGWIASSPLARTIANAHNIAIDAIAGSGPAGRIVKRDVERALARGTPERARARRHAIAPAKDIRIPLSGMRKVIAQRTSESIRNAPHYYLSMAINMEATIAARNTLNRSLKNGDTKISFNAFLIKFSAEALSRHAEINASWQEDHILQFGSIDVGLAVDVGNGLITPIVRDCAHKGIQEINDELTLLIEKARANSLTQDEYQGATHTISNLGSFGIDSFSAIINPPGAAIWAIGKTTPTPVVDEAHNIVIRPMMQTTLSCDHRVIDGRSSAQYLKTLKELIESPAVLLY